MKNMIDLSLSREKLEHVSEINMDEWIGRFNALAKEFGSCYGPDGVPCVSVGWFDETIKTTRWFELEDIVANDDYNSVNPDMATLLSGKTITILDGSFELEVERRTFGLEFITTEGKKIRDYHYTKSALVDTNHHVHRMGDKKQLEIRFLQFDNNPRRLGVKSIYGYHDGWDADFAARLD